MNFIAYYRVSTDKQGRSGLGLDAQKQAVESFVAGRGTILKEFTEVESGKRSDRPQLAEALAMCRQRKARLVIAKLDRLARNVHFISGLMESGVEFTACDMPEANRLTLHIIAAVAEHEREMISRRTKEALAAAKARGTKLGNPRPVAPAQRVRDLASAKAAQHRASVKPLIEKLRGQGLSLASIAKELNDRSVPTVHGKQWYPTTVKNVMQS
jgi:DNA invertase Pin-like site-specific DNA recombinase